MKFIVKSRDVQQPGKKGAKFHRTKSGTVHYGEQPTAAQRAGALTREIMGLPAQAASRASRSDAPKCVFCGRSGAGVQFAIFNPRFKPFGTACTDCEKTLPEGTKAP